MSRSKILLVVLFSAIVFFGWTVVFAATSAGIKVRTFVDGDILVPGAPTDFTGSALSSSEISLSWRLNGTSTVDYDLYRDNVFLVNLASSTLTYIDSGLSPKTTYSYQIFAFDKFLRQSPPSDTVTVTTLALGATPTPTPPLPPPQPTLTPTPTPTPTPSPTSTPTPIPTSLPPSPTIEPSVGASPPVEPPAKPAETGGGTETSKSGSIVSQVVNLVNDLASSTTTIPSYVREGFSNFVEPISPVAQAVSKSIPVPVTVTLAGASQIVNIAVSAGSFTDIYFLIIRQLVLLLEFFHIRKKRRPWGTVYDSVTKRPIDPAYVTVLRDGKEFGSAITDIDGRYSFVLPAGIYTLNATKTHYLFPSKLLAGKTKDELYDNLYFGQPITLGGDTVVEQNMPMDQVDFDWNEYVKDKKNYFKVNFRLAIVKSYFVGFLYAAGFLAAIGYLLTSFSWLNLFVLALYLLVFVFRSFYKHRHKVLSVINAASGDPLAFAVIRAYMTDVDQLVKTVVADEHGRFYILVRPGAYYLTVEAKKNDGSYCQVYRSEPQILTNGVLTKNLKIFVDENMLK